MKDQLIRFETAKLAKEKKFNWPVSWYGTHKRKAPTNPNSFYPQLSIFKNWNDDEELNFYDRYSLPTQSLLQKWLREVHNIHVNPIWCIDVYSCELYDMRKGIKGCQKDVFDVEWENNCTYEEALEKGLQEALKLIKTN